MPRRYFAYPEEFQVLNVLSTGGAGVLGLGYTLAFTYLVWSLFKGAEAPANPWGAKGLEWEAAKSPPITFNFDHDPIVTEPAYNYKPTREVTVG
jgi:cytochrome c oxidase subunit 1